MFLPPFRQPQAGSRVFRFGANTMAEWVYRPRARRIQGGKSAPADHHGRTRLALDKASAGVRAEQVVSGTRQDRQPTQGDDRRPSAQAAGCVVEICDRRSRNQGRDHEGRVNQPRRKENTIAGQLIIAGNPRGTNRSVAWLSMPSNRMVASSWVLTARKRDVGAADSDRRPYVSLERQGDMTPPGLATGLRPWIKTQSCIGSCFTARHRYPGGSAPPTPGIFWSTMMSLLMYPHTRCGRGWR